MRDGLLEVTILSLDRRSRFTGRRCRATVVAAVVLAVPLLTTLPLHAGAPAPDSVTAAVEPAGTTSGFDVDVASRYVWRGLLWSEREVVQPSLWISHGGTTLSLWGSAPVQGSETRFDEVDLVLAHERSFGSITLEGTASIYYYPDDPAAATSEVQLAASHGWDNGVSIGILASADVVEYPGATFGQASLSHEVALDGVTLRSEVRYGLGSPRFVTAYVAEGTRSLSIVGGSLSLTIPAGGLALRPHLELDRPVGGTSRRLVAEHAPLVVGLAVSREF